MWFSDSSWVTTPQKGRRAILPGVIPFHQFYYSTSFSILLEDYVSKGGLALGKIKVTTPALKCHVFYIQALCLLSSD